MSADNKMDLEKIKQIAAPLKERDAEKYEKGMKVLETCVGEGKTSHVLYSELI